MDIEDFEEALDEQSDQSDTYSDLQEGQLENLEAAYPIAKEQTNLYTWFWKVVRLDKPHKVVKVGNLTKAEIGEHGVSVRDAINLANLGRIFHHPTFANYFDVRASTIAATSMAKDGWFMDLSISQKRVRERAKKSSPLTPEKWRLFNKNKPAEQA